MKGEIYRKGGEDDEKKMHGVDSCGSYGVFCDGFWGK